MQRKKLPQAEYYTSQNQRRRIWQRIVSALACIVVFCTTYALILPAITMEKRCMLQEHTHMDSCYEQVTSIEEIEMLCSAETLEIHKHTKDCYDEEKNLVCGEADFVVHTHDALCYNAEGKLICTLPELKEHLHTKECYADSESHTHTSRCYTTERGALLCDLPETEGHTHDSGCYSQSLVCGQEESEEHTHSDGCYETELTCGRAEEEGHQHTNSCYEQENVLSCGLEEQTEETVPELLCKDPEIELHTHTEDCYDKDGVRICVKLEVLEHPHTEDCVQRTTIPVDTEALTCALAEDENHTHTARCYGTWKLVCTLPEHVHGDECYASASDTAAEEVEEDDLQQKVEDMIAVIDALPSSEEIEAELTALEEAGDEEGYETYFMEVSLQAKTAYAYFEELDPELQARVTNADKLLEMQWLWSAATLDITDILKVYQINQYSEAVTTLIQGGSVGDKLGSGMSYTYWDVIVVEKDGSGKLYVAQYVTEDGDKRGYKASTADGFVLLLYDMSVRAQVGDPVTVDFDYKTTVGYNASGYGTVSFGSTATPKPKPEKDNAGKLTIVPGADTRDLIEVNLYDYGSNINDLYNSNSKYPGFQQEYGSTNVGDSFNKWQSFNFGNNITEDLAAGKPNVTNHGGAINATTNGANSPISGAIQTTLGSDGQPALADGTSLGYLFSNSTYATKQNSQSINGLFQYNETTGAYTFNSRENHAQFNSEGDTFTLYQQIISSNFMMYPFGNFLPFNDIVKKSAQTSTIDRAYLQEIADSAQYKYSQGAGNAYGTLATQLKKFITLMDAAYGTNWNAANAINEYFKASGIPRTFDQNESLLQDLYSIDYDEPTDFYFGMEMKMNLMQPKGGLTGKDGKQPMVFYFTGDDDVWVYLDGKLFLDLSGIHRHVGGEIDFVNGIVKYYVLDVSTGDVSTTPYKTVKFSELVDASLLNEKGTFKDYSTHSFNFYYMERGAGSGVCRMNFNFPLLRQNTISVTKELSVDQADKLDLLGNPDFRFQILKENGTDQFIGGNVSYDILNTAGNKIGVGTTDENGVFVLKANQTAVFSGIEENSGKYFVRELLDPDAFKQYGQISVDGTSVTTGTGSTVIVGSDTFTGVDSPVKDVSDGSTTFHFDNQVTFNKLGSLQITKKLETYPQAREALQFQFHVTLDGTPLPVGTAYTVDGQTKTVTEEGIITLAPEETAVISGIIAGSWFTVQETTKSSKGYTVTYEGESLTPGTNENGAYVSGVIKTNTAVSVTVKNSEQGAAVIIPGVKTLTNPDGAEHTFQFKLEQVTNASDNTLVEGGTSQTISVDFPQASGETTASFGFQLTYLEKDITTLPATFYYKITEAAENPSQVQYDPAVYIAEVTVSRESGALTAELTRLSKVGADEKVATVSFTNTLVSDLTIHKQVKGDQAAQDTEFAFTVTLKQGDTPLSGTFAAVRSADGTDTTENVIFNENGQAKIKLKHGQSLKICGIPAGTAWTVAEQGADDYSVSHQINAGTETAGSTGSGTLASAGSSITFINASMYALPETGGAGTLPYTVGGIALIVGALMYWILRRRKGAM